MGSSSGSDPLIEARGITRHFPGVRALHDVNLTLGRGEILAVIGENGAGKSTLMKILGGILSPDAGELRLDGRPVTLPSVKHAAELGIGLIHQELNLADNLSIGANIFLGREPRRWGLIDEACVRREARELLERVGLELDCDRPVAGLSMAEQQRVEIAKALSLSARILIMDEPTSSLSLTETDQLLQGVRDLRDTGVSIIFITHRLREVQEIADRVVVLRDGENAGELIPGEVTHEAMVKLMVGREASQFYARSPHERSSPERSAPVLDVRGLLTRAHPDHEISMTLRAGEIVGLAGLVGAGRTELLRAIFGVESPVKGSIRVMNRELRVSNPAAAVDHGLAFVPEDRKTQGLILDETVADNLTLVTLREQGVFLSARREARRAADLVERFGIRTPTLDRAVRLLSGGNQQKIVLGKWLAGSPRVLLLDEPTRGIDVGAKHEIYALMDALAGEGLAILFASSELEEIIGMSDRVLVLHEGRLAGELPRKSLSEEALMRLATGSAA